VDHRRRSSIFRRAGASHEVIGGSSGQVAWKIARDTREPDPECKAERTAAGHARDTREPSTRSAKRPRRSCEAAPQICRCDPVAPQICGCDPVRSRQVAHHGAVVPDGTSRAACRPCAQLSRFSFRAPHGITTAHGGHPHVHLGQPCRMVPRFASDWMHLGATMPHGPAICIRLDAFGDHHAAWSRDLHPIGCIWGNHAAWSRDLHGHPAGGQLWTPRRRGHAREGQ